MAKRTTYKMAYKMWKSGLRRLGSLEIISRARSAIRAKYGGKEAEKQYPAPLNRYLEVKKLMFGDKDQLLILGHCYTLEYSSSFSDYCPDDQ